MKKTKTLTMISMLCAITIVLGFFKIPISNVIEIRFAHLSIAFTGFIFGPVSGAIVGIVGDIGGYMIRPTGPYFPGFTLSAALTGIIFGLFHKKTFSLKTIIIPSIINTIIVNILLNSYLLSLLYKQPFQLLLISRLPKECITLPIHILLLYLLIKPLINTKYFKKDTLYEL